VNVRTLATTAVLALTAGLLGATPAQAETFFTFTPQTILAPGLPKGGGVDQNVTPVGHISLDMTATQTAYVVSKMRVNNATIRSLFDNEVVCQGPGGWSKNMVIGQNVYDANMGIPAQRDFTLYTRFLVHPGVAGTVTCTANVRGNSLLTEADATYQLVSGYITFADTSVINDTNGQPVQSSVSSEGQGIKEGNPTARVPALEFFTLPPTVQGLNVVADIDLQVCWNSKEDGCTTKDLTKVKFTLIVNQSKPGGAFCKSDSSVVVTYDVQYLVHHKYVPLNKADFLVSKEPGCTQFNAYVKTEWLDGQTAGIQGMAPRLTDARGSTTTHDSDMSHAYVLPY
jgi:hypothetical protein